MKKKRVFALLLSIVMIAVMVLGNTDYSAKAASDGFSGSGSGTSSDPYIITNVQQLKEIKNDIYAYYELGNDIDLSGMNWEPIDWFYGSLDGKGHKIINMTIDVERDVEGEDVDNIGFFLTIDDASIKRIAFKKASISVNVEYKSNYNNAIGCGIITGRAWDDSVISDCSVEGNIEASYQNCTSSVGALLGIASIGTRIDNCYTNTYIEVSANQISHISNGVAYMFQSSINNCLIMGKVIAKGKAIAAGITGVAADSTVKNNVVALTELSSDSETYAIARGIEGSHISNNLVLDVDDSRLKDKDTFVNLGWDFDGTWTMGDSHPELSIFKDNNDISDAQVTLLKDKVIYSGNYQNPKVTSVYLHGKKLTEGTDYYVDSVSACNANEYRVTVYGKGSYYGSVAAKYTVEPKDISTAKIKLEQSEFEYDGTSPVIVIKSVTIDGQTLSSGIDYNYNQPVSKNVGEYSFEINGKNNYTGTAKTLYRIQEEKKSGDISGAQVTFLEDNVIYNGNYQNPEVMSVYLHGKKLTEGTDYYVSSVSASDAKVYKVTVYGKGSYYGSVTVNYTITPKDISTAKIELGQYGFIYNGTSPYITIKSVTIDGKTLQAGRDYNYTQPDNKNVGEYSFEINGKGNYTGTAKTSYRIQEEKKSEDISKAKVTLLEDKVVYNGNYRNPKVTSVYLNGIRLTEGIDYYVGSVSASDAKVYKVTVHGKGNYYGSVTVNYTITPKDISTAKIELAQSEFTYNGENPWIIIEHIKVDGKELEADTDYDFTWPDDTKIGEYEVVLYGKGNYTGTAKTQYRIISKNVEKKSQNITVKTKSIKSGTKGILLGAETSGDGRLTYKSGNKSVITIDSNGVMNARKPGKSVITVTASETTKYKKATKKVTITVLPKEKQVISVKSVPKIYTGKSSLDIKAKAKGDVKLKYSVDNKKIASVDNKGLVKLKGCGNLKITITAPETASYKKATKIITTKIRPQKVSSVRFTSPGKGRMSVSWAKDNRATGYIVVFSKDSSFSESMTRTVQTSRTSLSYGNMPGMCYYVKVRSSYKAGLYLGEWSEVKKVFVK